MPFAPKRTMHTLLALAAAAILSAPLRPAAADNWTRFLGKNGTGTSTLKGIPVTWSPADYAWDIKLPGEGHASPVIWGKKLFVTSALGTGQEGGRIRYLFCLDADTGEEIWSRTIGLSESHRHAKGSWASSTPAVDGERVYVAFADQEDFLLTAYDFDGRLLWRRNLGPFESQHGMGVSPVLFEDLVIIPNEQDGPSSILALDRASGETVWSTLRGTQAQGASYATPIIVQSKDGPPQLICCSRTMGVSSLDPRTGRLNWRTEELPQRTVASPAYGNGLIIQTCGQGGVGTFLVAVDPFPAVGGSADRVLYTRETNLPYVPTPIVYEDHLYLWNDKGTVCCVEIATGKNIWTHRVGGSTATTASPLCIDGKLYAVNEAGEVAVIAASPEYEFLGKTSLGDPSHATPAVANGKMYFRTFHRLICLPAQSERAPAAGR